MELKASDTSHGGGMVIGGVRMVMDGVWLRWLSVVVATWSVLDMLRQLQHVAAVALERWWNICQ